MTALLIFVAGWVYLNFIEYAWHRWVLHSGHHAIHNAHHRAFFTGEYESAGLLNRWAFLAAGLHVTVLCAISLKVAAIAALSVSSYLAVLEFVHRWQHFHPDSSLARWHIEHHRHPFSHFNVFLPLWDCLLGPHRA